MFAGNEEACREPLLSSITQIFCYPPREFIRIEHDKTEKCDRICEKVMEVIKCNYNLEITPIVRTLFGLRCKRSKLWVPDSHSLLHGELYEFRLRFKIPQMTELKSLNVAAYEYFFYQLAYDLLNDELNDIDYSGRRNTILGLCVTDMCIYRLKYNPNLTVDEMMLNYIDFLPEQIYRFTLFWPFKAIYDYFIKSTIKECFQNQVNLPHQTGYLCLMELYIEGILSLSKYYSNETYTAYMEDKCTLGEMKITILVQPFDKEEPGLCIKHSYGRIEKLCDIRDICEIDYNSGKYLNLYTNKDVIHSIRFKSPQELESFASCVSMYFRLICNWTINLCTELEFPSLIFLNKLKCHGPIEKELSKQKLEQAPWSDQKDGVFLVRQSKQYFRTLKMDILNWERKIVETLLIRMNEVNDENDEYQYVVLSPTDSTPQGPYSRLEEIAETSVPRCECIGPSYFDKSLRLLLCYSQEEPKNLNKNDDTKKGPIIEIENLSQIFDIFQTDTGDNADYKIFDLRRGKLKIPSQEKLIDVSIKSLKPNRIQFMSELLDNAFILRETSLSLDFMVKYYGCTIKQPSVFVMEPLIYGRLSKYLRNYRHRIQFDNLIEICNNLSKALNHIQTNGINYGKLRCSCLYVTSVSSTGQIDVKLGDPILPKSYTTKDLAWVPMEYRQKLYKNEEQFRKAFCNVAINKRRDQERDHEENENFTDQIRSDPTVLVWAYGTTIWEIFSYGQVIGKDLNLGLLRAPHLPVPDSCTSYPQIESIMLACWHTEKQGRIGFLNIQTMWNKIKKNLKSMPSPTLPDANEDSCNSSEDEDEIIRNIFLDKGKVQPEVPSRLQFKDYTITFKEKIDGNGNFSFLYRGEMVDAKGEEREVALKCLKKFRNALDFEKFRREAALMKDLRHQNIVTIYGFYEDIPYLNSIIIMEFLSAGSLHDYVRENHLPRYILLQFAADIAKGMAYLEEKKIIHRDLAARNVLVADENYAKVADFGLSVAKKNTDGKNPDVCAYGAYNWLAPEVLETEQYSFKSDVWAYGVTLYEIFTTSEPDYGIEEIPKLLQYLKTSNRLSIHCLDDAICESLIKPCWRLEASERPTYEDILKAIDNCRKTPSSRVS